MSQGRTMLIWRRDRDFNRRCVAIYFSEESRPNRNGTRFPDALGYKMCIRIHLVTKSSCNAKGSGAISPRSDCIAGEQRIGATSRHSPGRRKGGDMDANRTDGSGRRPAAIACALLLALVVGGAPRYVAAAAEPPPGQPEADAVRLLEQATWGPNEALVAHVRKIGVEPIRRRAVRCSPDEIHGVRAISGRATCDLHRRPHASGHAHELLRARQLHAVPVAARVLQERGDGARPTAPAGGVRAVADPRHVGDRHQPGVRDAALPADPGRPCVRQLQERADPGDVVAGDGQLSRHGQQPEAQPDDWRRAQRELRARSCCSSFRSGRSS